MSINAPILLLPLKLQARFVNEEIWIRAYPDEIHLKSFSDYISEDEIELGRKFKSAFRNPEKNESERKQAWHNLVSAYGNPRAIWLATQANLEEIKQNAENSPIKEIYGFLPEQLRFTIIDKDGIGLSETGEIIRQLGDEAIADCLKVFVDEVGTPSWIENFEEAIKVGMGVKIPIDKTKAPFKIVVVGRQRPNSDNNLNSLFENHLFSKGMEYLAPGTPTNNLNHERSGYSSQNKYDSRRTYPLIKDFLEQEEEPQNQLSLISEVESMDDDFSLLLYPEVLSKYLGVNPRLSKLIEGKHSSSNSFLSKMKYLLWNKLGKENLLKLISSDYTYLDFIKAVNSYLPFVQVHGLFPTLRIGRQPYAILPVHIPDEEKEDLDPANVRLIHFHKEICQHLEDAKEYRLPSSDRVKKEAIIPRVVNIPSGASTSARDFARILGMNHKSLRLEARVLNELEKSRNDSRFIKVIPDPGDVDLSNYPPYEWDSILNTPSVPAALPFYFKEPRNKEGRNLMLKLGIYKVPRIYSTQVNLEPLPQNLDFNLDDEAIKNILARSSEYPERLAIKFLPYTRLIESYVKLADDSPESLPKVEEIRLVKEGQLVDTNTPIIEYRWGAWENPFQVLAPAKGIISFHAVRPLVLDSETLGHREPGEVVASLDWVSWTRLLPEDDPERKDREEIEDIRELLRNYLQEIEDLGTEQLEGLREAFLYNLDTYSHRLDAHLMAFTHKRLHELRLKEQDLISAEIFRTKTSLGAYGYLEELRPSPIVVEDTDSGELLDVDDTPGGIIHTPHASQAMTAAIMKNSFHRHRGVDRYPFALNINSERIQQARSLIEGLQQGQALEALLGYRLERKFHEANLDYLIYEFRRRYPFTTQVLPDEQEALAQNPLIDEQSFALNHNDLLNVIDGKKVVEQIEEIKKLFNGIKEEVSKPAIEALHFLVELFDASKDLLLFEGVHHSLRGSYTKASAAFSTLKGKRSSVDFSSVQTKFSQNNFRHTFALLIPTQRRYNSITVDPKRLAEPSLYDWMENQIGPVENLAYTLHAYKQDEEGKRLEVNIPVRLTNPGGNKFPKESNLSHLDLLYLSKEEVSKGSSELERRLWHFAIQSSAGKLDETFIYEIRDTDLPDGTYSLLRALELYRKTYQMFEKGSPLFSEDIASGEESWTALEEIRQRFWLEGDEDYKTLMNWLDLWKRQSRSGPRVIEILAKFNVEAAKNMFTKGWEEFTERDHEQIQEQVEEILSEVEREKQLYIEKFQEKKDFKGAFGHLAAICKSLFGKDFVLLPPAYLNEELLNQWGHQEALIPIKNESNLGISRLEKWVDQLSAVRESVDSFQSWELYRSIWQEELGIQAENDFRIAQFANTSDFPWVGLSKKEISEKIDVPEESIFYPKSAQSILTYGTELDGRSRSLKSGIIHGWVFEQFSESVPDESHNTALAFQYNAPSNEAANTLLLCVPNEQNTWWDNQELTRHVLHAFELAKARLMDLEGLSHIEDFLGPYLPLSYLPIKEDKHVSG